MRVLRTMFVFALMIGAMLTMTFRNPEKASAHEVEAVVDCNAITGMFTEFPPGWHVITVKGTINGQPFSVKETVTGTQGPLFFDISDKTHNLGLADIDGDILWTAHGGGSQHFSAKGLKCGTPPEETTTTTTVAPTTTTTIPVTTTTTTEAPTTTTIPNTTTTTHRTTTTTVAPPMTTPRNEHPHVVTTTSTILGPPITASIPPTVTGTLPRTGSSGTFPLGAIALSLLFVAAPTAWWFGRRKTVNI